MATLEKPSVKVAWTTFQLMLLIYTVFSGKEHPFIPFVFLHNF